MNWYDYQKFKYYEEFESLRDIVIKEYNAIKESLDFKNTGLYVTERYKTKSTNINWYGYPLMDATIEDKKYSQYWPETMKKLKSIPGVLNACVNFVGPNSLIPDHVDVDISKQVIGDKTAVGTIIGISMPSSDPNTVGFHVEGEVKGWGTGDIVCIDGYKNHGGWNKTDEWRITLLFDSDKSLWDIR